MTKHNVQIDSGIAKPDSVYISIGVTMNMGDYEALRVDVGQWEPSNSNKPAARKRAEREVVAELKRVCGVAKKLFPKL